jgi:hypothetical protein
MKLYGKEDGTCEEFCTVVCGKPDARGIGSRTSSIEARLPIALVIVRREVGADLFLEHGIQCPLGDPTFLEQLYETAEPQEFRRGNGRESISHQYLLLGGLFLLGTLPGTELSYYKIY